EALQVRPDLIELGLGSGIRVASLMLIREGGRKPIGRISGRRGERSDNYQITRSSYGSRHSTRAILSGAHIYLSAPSGIRHNPQPPLRKIAPILQSAR